MRNRVDNGAYVDSGSICPDTGKPHRFEAWSDFLPCGGIEAGFQCPDCDGLWVWTTNGLEALYGMAPVKEKE